MLNAGNWNAHIYSESGAIRPEIAIQGENPVKLADQTDHFLDWLQCIHYGGIPHAPIEAGYQHAVAVLMAAKSYETGQKIIYDDEQQIIQ